MVWWRFKKKKKENCYDTYRMVVLDGTCGTRSSWRNIQRTVDLKHRQRVGHRTLLSDCWLSTVTTRQEAINTTTETINTLNNISTSALVYVFKFTTKRRRKRNPNKSIALVIYFMSTRRDATAAQDFQLGNKKSGAVIAAAVNWLTVGKWLSLYADCRESEREGKRLAPWVREREEKASSNVCGRTSVRRSGRRQRFSDDCAVAWTENDWRWTWDRESSRQEKVNLLYLKRSRAQSSMAWRIDSSLFLYTKWLWLLAAPI